jgi:FkbH-like protein
LNDKRNILKINDFVTHRINWEKKYKNILSIKKELNIGLDSIVFLDDNPSERFEVMNFIPEVNVPDLGSSHEDYLNIINSYNYFNFKSTSLEDKKRSFLYLVEKKRQTLESKSASYSQFLKSLDTRINFINLNAENINRVHQLTNKTNQFNFTTKRMQINEINKFKLKNKKILIIRAKDKFGDYGIISVVYINFKKELEIENWLMSCRVFNKTIEHSIMQELKKIAKKNKKAFIKLTYLKNDKNKILEKIIQTLGFVKTKKNNQYIFNIKNKLNVKNNNYCRIFNG